MTKQEQIEKARKETAKEILSRINEYYLDYNYDLKKEFEKLCKDYCVDFEERRMKYSEEQKDALLAVCNCYKNDHDKDFERLKAQQRDIDRLKIQLEQANTGIVNCSGCKLVEINAVKEFAEKVKKKALSHCRIINCYECKFIEITIDELIKEYEK